MVIVERAKALVLRNLEPKSLCDPLDGEVAELLKFLLVHQRLRLRYNFVFEYRPVCGENSMKCRLTQTLN